MYQKDSQRIYFLSSFNKTIDGLTAVTYNISASDCYNVLTIEDISTDLKFREKILSELSEKSVQQNELKEFIVITYLIINDYQNSFWERFVVNLY